MLVAYGPSGGRRRATVSGERGTCPDCGSEVTAVVPEQLIIAHWRHLSEQRECRSNTSNYEPETPWHQSWKLRISGGDPDRIEVSYGPHRADALSADGWVVEMQHSPIGQPDVAAREAFYPTVAPGMVWITDSDVLGTAQFPVFHDERGRIVGKYRFPAWRRGYVEVRRRGTWEPAFKNPTRAGDVFRWHPGREESTLETWGAWSHDEFLADVARLGMGGVVARLRERVHAAIARLEADRDADERLGAERVAREVRQEAALRAARDEAARREVAAEAARRVPPDAQQQRAAEEWEAGRPAREAAKRAADEQRRQALQARADQAATERAAWEAGRSARLDAAALFRCRRTSLGLAPHELGIAYGDEMGPEGITPEQIERASQPLWRHFLRHAAQEFARGKRWSELVLHGWSARHFREAGWFLGDGPASEAALDSYGPWDGR